jgi:hypothetical protein
LPIFANFCQFLPIFVNFCQFLPIFGEKICQFFFLHKQAIYCQQKPIFLRSLFRPKYFKNNTIVHGTKYFQNCFSDQTPGREMLCSKIVSRLKHALSNLSILDRLG